MNYDRTFLELLEKVKELEERVTKLENGNISISPSQKGKTLTQQARDYIMEQKNNALEDGEESITLLCNDIQNALGVTNRTPCICTAMYDCMKPGDEVLSAPASGKSTTVLVRYYLSNEKSTSVERNDEAMTLRQLRTDFEDYFHKKKPNYKYPGPLFGMAFYCTKHDIGVTLEDLFSGRVTLDEYEDILIDLFESLGSSNVMGRTSAYKDAMKNLLEYVHDYHLENIRIINK